MIRIQGLHKFFNKGRQNEIHVINDVNLELPESGMVAVFGKSGCGKTTLLNVIGGLDKFSEGTLTVENQNIKENTDVLRNRYIGYIFQNYNLNKEETCFDNVADALRLCGMRDEAEIESRVMAALTNVGMEKYAKRLPDTLSGGQQQRIAIARAIVKNPRIILADEPTGNLDEANTVMIMDLLKAISEDHLVILVTHEANLVDFYCDTVIELQDGKVVGTKQNTAANGFAARDKNDIYLGELSHREVFDEATEIEYYGEMPEQPIKLKIVNHGGKIYLQLGTQTVQILDEFSEVKLREGIYEEKPSHKIAGREIDMSALPPIQGHSFGRLFSLRSSIKSGYAANFKNHKKGKKLLRRCMCLFAAVIVFTSAVFGSAIKDIIETKAAYNHNVFYLYTPDTSVSKQLNEAVGREDTGVDYIRLTNTYPRGDEGVSFRTGTFETFAASEYASNLNTNAVYLGASLAKKLTPVAGKGWEIADNEILVTTAVADALLEKSTLGYIREYRDLIGLVCSRLYVDGTYLRIAGVVASDESSIYLNEMTMAKYIVGKGNIKLASDYGVEVVEGEAVLLVYDYAQSANLPKIGESVLVCGRSVKITAIQYGEELYTNSFHYGMPQNSFLLSDTDYVACSKQVGETYALGVSYGDYDYDKAVSSNDATVMTVDVMTEESYIGVVEYGYDSYYTVIHSNAPEKTEAWLQSQFSELSGPSDYQNPILTPNMLYERMMTNQTEDIVKSLVTMVVVLVLMSVCMYFIMRSSLMNRIKEVGIYRAIGVSKRNLIFKFFVEAIVLTVMSVLIGYAFSCAFIYVCLGMSSLVESVFYYPIWLAGSNLLLLCAISLFFGTLPIMGLLRRTPSEILAKYDI